MPTDQPPLRVEFTPLFLRFLKALAKKYRNVRMDFQPIIEQLQRGESPGDRIPGTGYAVYKVRVRNSDVRRGKSGGYRVIYWHRESGEVILLAIYSKTERVDISGGEIRRMIEDYENLPG